MQSILQGDHLQRLTAPRGFEGPFVKGTESTTSHGLYRAERSKCDHQPIKCGDICEPWKCWKNWTISWGGLKIIPMLPEFWISENNCHTGDESEEATATNGESLNPKDNSGPLTHHTAWHRLYHWHTQSVLAIRWLTYLLWMMMLYASHTCWTATGKGIMCLKRCKMTEMVCTLMETSDGFVPQDRLAARGFGEINTLELPKKSVTCAWESQKCIMAVICKKKKKCRLNSTNIKEAFTWVNLKCLHLSFPRGSEQRTSREVEKNVFSPDLSPKVWRSGLCKSMRTLPISDSQLVVHGPNPSCQSSPSSHGTIFWSCGVCFWPLDKCGWVTTAIPCAGLQYFIKWNVFDFEIIVCWSINC